MLGGRFCIAADLLGRGNVLVCGARLLLGVVGQPLRLAACLLGGRSRGFHGLVGQAPGLDETIASFRHERRRVVLRRFGIVLRGPGLLVGLVPACVEFLF